jgi:hypothetical protein
LSVGISLTPRYQLRIGTFEGCPTVELLALPIIKEFIDNTGDDGNTSLESQYVRDEFGSILQIWVEMHEEFVRLTGETIHRPWLQIQRSQMVLRSVLDFRRR